MTRSIWEGLNRQARRKPGRPPKPVGEPGRAFPRADPAALAAFDPSTKRCAMNCGPHRDDPRDERERRFLCDECETVRPAG